MINALHLLWIVPIAMLFGIVLAALLTVSK